MTTKIKAGTFKQLHFQAELENRGKNNALKIKIGIRKPDQRNRNRSHFQLKLSI